MEALGERLAELAAASRGSPSECQEARRSAVSLKRDMQQLEQDLQRRGAPERTVVAVRVSLRKRESLARARAWHSAAQVPGPLFAGISALQLA